MKTYTQTPNGKRYKDIVTIIQRYYKKDRDTIKKELRNMIKTNKLECKPRVKKR